MRKQFFINLFVFFLLLSFTCSSREVPLNFPPKDGIDPASMQKCESLLDVEIPGGINFINYPTDDFFSFFTSVGSGIGISHSTNVKDCELILPETPETVTICMKEATYREALNKFCSVAHLSWRLEPERPFESYAWIWISICRPEQFLNENKNKFWLDDWFPILFLLAIGGLFLVPILFFSIFPLMVKEDLATELLGRKYRHLLNPSLKDYFVGQVAGTVMDKILPVSSDLISAAYLRHLITMDRKAAVEYAYRILKAKGKRVPKDAWNEFFRRNPEAKHLMNPENEERDKIK